MKELGLACGIEVGAAAVTAVRAPVSDSFCCGINKQPKGEYSRKEK